MSSVGLAIRYREQWEALDRNLSGLNGIATIRFSKRAATWHERFSSIAKGNTGPVSTDDLGRKLTVAMPDGTRMRYIAVVGDTYTIPIADKDTEGCYYLIDMLVPDGSGPCAQRHDFEEMFSLLEGKLQFAFRGRKRAVEVLATRNAPSNTPHAFRNTSGKTVHMLCMCTPAGLDEIFMKAGVPVKGRDVPSRNRAVRPRMMRRP